MSDSPFAIAVKAARDLIALSSTFQTATGTADQAAALARVHYDENPDADDRENYPFAIVSVEPSSRLTAVMAGCPQTSLIFTGSVLVELVAWADTTGDGPYVNFLNYFGNVLADMNGDFNSDDDTFGFQRIELLTPPIRTPHNNRSQEDFYFIGCVFHGPENES